MVADLREEQAEAAVKTLHNAGFDGRAASVDISSRDSILKLIETARVHGKITGFVNEAGVSPSQAPIETILKVDLYGTAVLLEGFGRVIEKGGSGVVISSQSGHRLGPLFLEDGELLAVTPTEELLKLPLPWPENIKDALHANQLSKRCNVLRVMSGAVKWGQRGARVNSISPGS